ncbi:MAG: GMC family oxidoreductase N-terminal domain-containing protein [Caldilineaceae bacterium]
MICAGGAINSPQLLQLSGIGNVAELEALGIDVVHDLPGVGENLQRSFRSLCAASLQTAGLNEPRPALVQCPVDRVSVALCAVHSAATNHFEAGGFIRSNGEVPSSQHLDVSLSAAGGALRWVGSILEGMAIRCMSG